MSSLCGVAVTAVLLLQTQPTEIAIKSDAPRYAVNLPRGFKPTDPRENPERYVRSYGPETWVQVGATLIHGTGPLNYNPSGITAEEILPFVPLPADAKRTFQTMKWKDLDVGVIEYQAVVKDLPVIGLSVVLPLHGRALTLTVSAPTPLEKEAREEFKEILSRITNTASNWYTPEEIRKIQTMDIVGKAGAGLMVLYLIAWVVLFRNNPMGAHWVRVAWLLAIAVLLFIPIGSPGPVRLGNNLVINGVLPLVMISFAVRRIKLGVESE